VKRPARSPVRRLVLTLALAGLTALACSPEATRTRYGGLGGDVGNRSPVVELHGPNQPRTSEPEGMFFQTPKAGQAVAK
jgi:hypothetical protein